MEDCIMVKLLTEDILCLLKKQIDKKLNESKSVTLMADIWTNAIMVPYIGVAASVGYDLTKKEILVIGFERMPAGNHNSESLKFAIEKIINNYSFDKSKIAGI